MKILAFLALVILAGTFAPARAAEFAAELPPGAQIKREIPTWGREVEGLQLGISLDYLNRPYRIGEVAAVTLSVRNNRKTAVALTTSKPDWLIVPTVVRENGAALPFSQQALLVGPGYNIGVYSVTQQAAPGQTVEVAKARLTIGPPGKDESNPALNVEPGRYKLSYNYPFQPPPPNQKNATSPWSGVLESGQITLEVAASDTTTITKSPAVVHVDEKFYQWGREVNGLQLGAQMQVPGEVIPATKPVPLGTVVTFALAVRNVGQTPREIKYWRSGWSITPRVFDEAGQPMFYNLLDPARGGPVFPITRTLAPGESVEFDRAQLAIGLPDKKFGDPTLTAPPGKYRVRYAYDFTPEYRRKAVVTDPVTGEKTQPAKDENDVPWAEVTLEVAPENPAGQP